MQEIEAKLRGPTNFFLHYLKKLSCSLPTLALVQQLVIHFSSRLAFPGHSTRSGQRQGIINAPAYSRLGQGSTGVEVSRCGMYRSWLCSWIFSLKYPLVAVPFICNAYSTINNTVPWLGRYRGRYGSVKSTLP